MPDEHDRQHYRYRGTVRHERGHNAHRHPAEAPVVVTSVAVPGVLAAAWHERGTRALRERRPA